MTSEEAVYAGLGPNARMSILRAAGISSKGGEEPPALFSDLKISTSAKLKLTEIAYLVHALSDGDAGTLVNDALSGLGWTADDFMQSLSLQDRAAFLVSEDRAMAEDVARWWHTNRSFWRKDTKTGFVLQDTSIDPACFDNADFQRLEQRIGLVLSEHLPGHRVRKISLTARPSTGIPATSDHIIQIDVRISKPAELVAIEENDDELHRSLRFLADISIIIDPEKAVLFVSSSSQKKQFRQDIAQEVRTHFLGIGGAPPILPPWKVHVSRLSEPVGFSYNLSDRLEYVRVKSLSYRRYLDGSPYTGTVVASDRRTNIYGLPEVARNWGTFTVYRADVEFQFKSRPGDSVGRIRSVTLRDGHSVAYGRCSPEEAAIIEGVLVKAGLLGGTEAGKKQKGLSQLGRICSGGFAQEIRTALGDQLYVALEKLEVLAPRVPDNTAWCQQCLTSHGIVDHTIEGRLVPAIDCLLGRRALDPMSAEMVRLDEYKLAHWIARSIGADQTVPKGIDPRSWFLGAIMSERGKAIGVGVTAHAVPGPELAALHQYLNDHPKLPAGIMLVIDNAMNGIALPRGWKTAPLDGCVELMAGQLSADRVALVRMFDGKLMRPVSHKATRDELLAYFDKTDTSYGAYVEAERMLAANPEWHWAQDTIARILKKQRPERFK